MTVVTIHDGIEIRPGEADPAVVAELERLLEKARSGAIIGLVGVVVWPDQLCESVQVGWYNRAMVGTLEMVKADIVHDLRHRP